MNGNILAALLAAITVVIFDPPSVAAENARSPIPAITDQIKLPIGFSIEIYAERVAYARSLALGSDGTVYVGTRKEEVYALPDQNRDGKVDQTITIADGLTIPNGVAVADGNLYVAEVPRILRFSNIGANLFSNPKPEVIFDAFPKKLHHGSKYLRVGPDGQLYTSVGAPCNVCNPEKEIFGTMTRLRLDGSEFEIYAHGIRSSVGFDWHPKTNELWFSENGRDWLGDDLPPDELNRAPKKGLHFGFPHCHAGNISDPKFGQRVPCDRFEPPEWRFPAHVAPLGVKFYRGDQFPTRYKHALFVAQHGSWNRTEPQGYRIVVVKFENGLPISENVFAEGWLREDGKVLGRPVDLLELADGSLLVSDDRRGVIYKISYTNLKKSGRR